MSHDENNCGWAVKRLNAITAQLVFLDFASAAGDIDYGAAAAKRVDACMDIIKWTNVARLHQGHAR